ncbi:MAG: peptidoglycan editing factor PgeF [Neomegalonema sp.]|nr:peptidoglycan editing factor PgeF [Neomegalonema sp.]
MIETLTHPALAARHGFFTRKGGVSGGIYASLQCGWGAKADTVENVRHNRALVAEHIGVAPDHLLSAFQVHSAASVITETPWQNEAPQVDGIVTATPGLAIGILTADCAPILFQDPQAQVIGGCHAGWKGALDGVIEDTLAKMASLGARADAISAVIGPCIGPDWYEVGAEYQERFEAADPQNRRFFRPSPLGGHALFDLPAYCLARLKTAGVAQASWVGACTYDDEARFYSNRRAVHRKEGDYGRLISVIRL